MEGESESMRQKAHRTTQYRRRDLRNGLAVRMGMEDRFKPEEPPKKRLRFSELPVTVSDFTIEDFVKEFGTPIYTKFYEWKEGRSAVFEFEQPEIMDKIVEKYDKHEIDGKSITVEIYETRQKKPNRKGRGQYGSHYNEEISKDNKQKSKVSDKKDQKPLTVESLDAELEEYMKK